MEFTKEMIEKAKQVKSAEELLALAKENQVEMTLEEANEKFAQLHSTGELSDDELDNVSGGCGSDNSSSGLICKKCGGTLVKIKNQSAQCPNCKNSIY